MKYYYLDNENGFRGNYGQICDDIIVEKQSKFISYLFKINSEEEALEKIEQIRKDNVGARHVVYIYSYLNESVANIRFSDDGEPKGTGTKAIYELIDKEAITNVCIVIVRYFGGILLGAGPLSRTYLNSARKCIDACVKKDIYNYKRIETQIVYNKYNILRSRLNQFSDKEHLKIISCKFNENVDLVIDIVDFKEEELLKIIEEINYGN